MRTRLSLEERARFESKLVKHDNDNWEYIGGHDKAGYPMFSLRGRTVRVHRLVYELYVGPIPKNKPHVCHRDDNPNNPAPGNLFAGSRSENMIDMVNKGRHSWATGRVSMKEYIARKAQKSNQNKTK